MSSQSQPLSRSDSTSSLGSTESTGSLTRTDSNSSIDSLGGSSSEESARGAPAASSQPLTPEQLRLEVAAIRAKSNSLKTKATIGYSFSALINAFLSTFSLGTVLKLSGAQTLEAGETAGVISTLAWTLLLAVKIHELNKIFEQLERNIKALEKAIEKMERKKATAAKESPPGTEIELKDLAQAEDADAEEEFHDLEYAMEACSLCLTQVNFALNPLISIDTMTTVGVAGGIAGMAVIAETATDIEGGVEKIKKDLEGVRQKLRTAAGDRFTKMQSSISPGEETKPGETKTPKQLWKDQNGAALFDINKQKKYCLAQAFLVDGVTSGMAVAAFIMMIGVAGGPVTLAIAIAAGIAVGLWVTVKSYRARVRRLEEQTAKLYGEAQKAMDPTFDPDSEKNKQQIKEAIGATKKNWCDKFIKGVGAFLDYTVFLPITVVRAVGSAFFGLLPERVQKPIKNTYRKISSALSKAFSKPVFHCVFCSLLSAVTAPIIKFAGSAGGKALSYTTGLIAGIATAGVNIGCTWKINSALKARCELVAEMRLAAKAHPEPAPGEAEAKGAQEKPDEATHPSNGSRATLGGGGGGATNGQAAAIAAVELHGPLTAATGASPPPQPSATETPPSSEDTHPS